MVLPGDLYLPLAQGYGKYRVEAVADLDKLEKKRGELVRLSLQEGLGVGIDEMIDRLNWWDLVRLRWGMVKGYQVDKLQLDQLVRLKRINLPDGTVGQEFDPEAVDELVRKLFAEDKLRQSDLRLAVVNATNHTGLGEKVRRLAENMGLVVVNVMDTPDLRGGSNISLGQEVKETDYVVDRLKALFEMPVRADQDTSGERADVVIWIGEDYWDRVFK